MPPVHILADCYTECDITGVRMLDRNYPVYDSLAALLGEGDISLSFEKYILG